MIACEPSVSLLSHGWRPDRMRSCLSAPAKITGGLLSVMGAGTFYAWRYWRSQRTAGSPSHLGTTKGQPPIPGFLFVPKSKSKVTSARSLQSSRPPHSKVRDTERRIRVYAPGKGPKTEDVRQSLPKGPSTYKCHQCLTFIHFEEFDAETGNPRIAAVKDGNLLYACSLHMPG